jgi:hypothetical protein
MSITTPGPLGEPDKFTVTNLSDGKPYAGGIHIKGMRMSTALALEDGHGKELASIFKSGGKMGKPAMYEICGYHPFVKSQMSIQGQPGKDGKELFSWAKVSRDGFGSLKLHVKIFKGHDDYVETYYSEPNMPEGGPATLKDRYPPVIFKKTDGEYVAFVSATHSTSIVSGPCWKAHIAPGMDPCLFICCLAILDEYEKNRQG